MKLLSLRVNPGGSEGWSSKELKFGAEITQLHGPNGCGKTPIIQSLVYCLGFPVSFRDDILERCKSVEVAVEVGGLILVICREIGPQFDISVIAQDEAEVKFYDERDYSKFLFEALDISYPQLTSVSNKPTPPYLATILPIFYLDQDSGYADTYQAPRRFIRDQYPEMLRIILDVPPKHSFEQKRTRIKMNEAISTIDRKIVRQSVILKDLDGDVGEGRAQSVEIERDILRYQADLEKLRHSKDIKSDGLSALNSIISDKKTAYTELGARVDGFRNRVQGIESIKNEINMEVDTLGLNEEARRHFLSFEDICNNPDCGMFFGSSESYGKNLLYLKDQMKDLTRHSETLQAKIGDIENRKSDLESEIRSLLDQRDGVEKGSDVSLLVEAIGDITGKIHELETERKLAEILELEENKYVEMISLRDKSLNELASLGGRGGKSDLYMLRLRSRLCELIGKWLEILNTPNVSREISVDNDFEPSFGNESLNQFKGSTRVRVVLAIHAAILELYLEKEEREIRLFILDTPKQQEMQTEHLSQYFVALKKLASEQSAQIVFSTTEYRYERSINDVDWVPEFDWPDQKMFLG